MRARKGTTSATRGSGTARLPATEVPPPAASHGLVGGTLLRADNNSTSHSAAAQLFNGFDCQPHRVQSG
jgi:hypothetical protein